VSGINDNRFWYPVEVFPGEKSISCLEAGIIPFGGNNLEADYQSAIRPSHAEIGETANRHEGRSAGINRYCARSERSPLR
jgi:hypothetical protein